jgi:hypothetical protein
LQWKGFTDSTRGYGTAYHARAYHATEEGWSREYYDSLAVDDTALARGVADGVFTIDTRLRGALRTLRVTVGDTGASRATEPYESGLRRFALPSTAGETLHFAAPEMTVETGVAVDAAILDEANRVRQLRQVDAIEARLDAFEAQMRPSLRSRLASTLGRPARKGRV